MFFIPLENYVEHFRCTCINYKSSSAVKVSNIEYDFSTQEDDDRSFQIASFALQISRDIDLSNEVLAISIY